MLVLSRKNGETVCISRGIEVKVLSISRNTVKLGFSAPPQVDIRRQELTDSSEQHSDQDTAQGLHAAVSRVLASC